VHDVGVAAALRARCSQPEDVKLDADEGARPELSLADFVVSDEVMRLMSLLDRMKCGTIRRVEVRSGVPRRIQMTEAPG
jgi:hypothetical protein